MGNLKNFARWLVVAVLATVVAASAAYALDEGARAPEVGLSTLDGRPVRLADLRGKVVLIDFWASWCGPCREEMPFLERMHRRYASRGLVIVGISVDNELENVRGFLRRTSVSFPIVHDSRREVAGRYNPRTMPSSYIIDRRGIVRVVHRGFRASDAATIEARITQLLDAR